MRLPKGEKKMGSVDRYGNMGIEYSWVIEYFKKNVTKENVLNEVRSHGSFVINYRLMINKTPNPVALKAAMFRDGKEEKLVVGIRKWKDRDLDKS